MNFFERYARKCANYTNFIAILFFVLFLITYSLNVAIDIPTFHLDGAFQTASGLFRLESGQLPGRDFYPYLGIGPLASLYPVFKMAGSNLAASVFSAQFMTLLFSWLSISLLWHFVFRPNLFLDSLSASAFIFTAFIVGIKIFSIEFLDPLLFLMSPGNSLRPIRIMAPYLVALIYYFSIYDLKSAKLRGVFSGFISGFILLWSNDFAIITVFFFALLFFLIEVSKKEFNVFTVLRYFSFSLVSWLVLISFVTAFHSLDLLKYNFFDVAKDQWWYFGPYSESSRIFRFFDLYRIVSVETLVSLLVLFLMIIATYKKRDIEKLLHAWIGIVLFMGGVVASVGGHIDGYFSGFYAYGFVTIIFYSMKILKVNAGNIFPVILFRLFNFSFCILSSAFIILIFLFSFQKYQIELQAAKNDHTRFFVVELGGYLNLNWKDYITLARNTKTPHVLEEYWGLWSATRRIIPSWPVDSVIHALGQTRSLAEIDTPNADIIISTRNSLSREWQTWGLSQNYWFYKELLKGYSPQYMSPNTVVWKKESSLQTRFGLPASIHCKDREILINAPQSGFYELEFSYEFNGKRRSLILVENNVSYSPDSDGFISLPPQSGRAMFPVYLSKDSDSVLDVRVLEDGEVKFFNCKIRQIYFENDEVLAIPGNVNENFYVTDHYWTRGIAKRSAGFYIPYFKDNRDKYKKGRIVDLGNGELRKIIKVERSGPYLNVTLDGEILDPDSVGFPSSFTVVNDNNARILK